MKTFLLGLLIVGGFVAWKFWIQPIMNEGKPIEPPNDYKTFGEQIEDAIDISGVNTKIDLNPDTDL